MQPTTPILPEVRGWCPSVHAPLEATDGWMVRIRVGCRPVEAHQWRAVAELADGEGNGQVEFTSRGNLQLRGLRRTQVPTVAAALTAAGLAGADDSDEWPRAVVRHPLLDVAVESVTTTERLRVAVELEALLARRGSALPPKWWIALDADLPWPMATETADVAVRHRAATWEVRCGDLASKLTGDPVPLVAEVVAACAAAGCRARDLDVVELIASRAGDTPPTTSPARSERSSWWGVRELGQFLVAGAGPMLGVAAASSLHALADAALTPDVSVRPTPQRGVVVVAPAERRATVNRVLDALAVHGWVTRPDDPRRFVTACIGARGCPSGLVDTHALAADLNAAGTLVEPVHLSGCPKRCGSPPRTRELIATAGGLVEAPL